MNDPLSIRFPHFCTVRRISGVDPFIPDDPFHPDNLDADGFPVSEESEKVIYSGPCRRESNTNIRSFSTGLSSVGQVMHVDYRVSMPGKVMLRKGDIIDVDYIIGFDKGMTVLHPNYSTLKTPDTPDGSTECYYNLSEI